MEDETSVQLLQRWRDGDEHAAAQMFERYVNRLCALAKSRLSNQMQRRVEPEDIVQSAYRSFFCKAADRYELKKSGDLWRLLATITVSKVRGQVEHHTAQKRGVYAEESVMIMADQSMVRVNPEAVAEDPKPDDAAAMIEELTDVMSGLDPVQRTIVELSMQDQSVEQIAETVERSQRTVRRTLQRVREDLENRLQHSIRKAE